MADAGERGSAGLEGAGWRPPPAAPFVAAAVADLCALGVLLRYGAAVSPAIAAAALHVAAVLPFAATRGLAASERALGAAYVFALPLAGAPIAALALATEGRLEVDRPEAALPGAGAPELPRVDELRRLGEALPCCEALLAGGIEERRAILATLTRRADADAVAVLRWALGAPDPELAVDAALAIEEMTATFEGRLAEAREELVAAPASAEAALAVAEVVTQGIDAGVVDSALVPRLAQEARRGFVAAAAAPGGDTARALAIAVGRARLELQILRPDTALACIDEALERLPPESHPLLLALREEAVLASHSLPWEGPSALATYQHPGAPPPLTARRRFGTARALAAARGTGGVTVGPVQIPPLGGTHKVRRDGH
jgi:hypothetical protein